MIICEYAKRKLLRFKYRKICMLLKIVQIFNKNEMFFVAKR